MDSCLESQIQLLGVKQSINQLCHETLCKINPVQPPVGKYVRAAMHFKDNQFEQTVNQNPDFSILIITS